ncbi:MAG: DUF433 domain-containing protein [Proteobacteria bacterium]|nr:DUF433 domain-containing protein [Pseudomonadota bacterium]
MNSVIAAFSDDQVVRLTGVRKGQLRYWDKSDFYSPSYSNDQYRDGFGRVYSFQDVIALKVLGILRNVYDVSVQHLREVKRNLRDVHRKSWTGVRLYVVNKRVHWVEPETGLPQDLASKQYIISSIDLDLVVNQIRGDVADMTKRPKEKVGQVERVRSLNGSDPVLAGTRITVSSIKRFSEAGYSELQILDEYPDLTLEDVRAALSFSEVA